ncbi:MAG TPA: hypothetical protein VIT67_12120 [Povalibacter sp.]
MNVLTLITVVAASVLAVSFAYSTLPSQRWWREVFAPFPARVTSVLAVVVALKGWVEILGALQGTLTWLSTLIVPLAVLFMAGNRSDTGLHSR